MNVRAKLVVEFFGELPEDTHKADNEFDNWCSDLEIILNRYRFGNGIVNESFSVIDGDTEEVISPDDLDWDNAEVRERSRGSDN